MQVGPNGVAAGARVGWVVTAVNRMSVKSLGLTTHTQLKAHLMGIAARLLRLTIAKPRLRAVDPNAPTSATACAAEASSRLPPPTDQMLSRWTMVQILVVAVLLIGLKVYNATSGGFGRRRLKGMDDRYDEPPCLEPVKRGEKLRELEAPPIHTRAVASCMGIELEVAEGRGTDAGTNADLGGGSGAECEGGGVGGATCAADQSAIDASQLAELSFSSTRGGGLVTIGGYRNADRDPNNTIAALSSTDASQLQRLGACVARVGLAETRADEIGPSHRAEVEKRMAAASATIREAEVESAWDVPFGTEPTRTHTEERKCERGMQYYAQVNDPSYRICIPITPSTQRTILPRVHATCS